MIFNEWAGFWKSSSWTNLPSQCCPQQPSRHNLNTQPISPTAAHCFAAIFDKWVWVNLVIAVLKVANLSAGSLPCRGVSKKVHSYCPRAVSWLELSHEPVPWGAGVVCMGMCSVMRSGDLWQRSWAKSWGTWPAELLLQGWSVVFNQSWARKCEQNYQKNLCDVEAFQSIKHGTGS